MGREQTPKIAQGLVWVPEDHIFDSASECLEIFSEQAAAGLAKPNPAIQSLVDAARELLESLGECDCGFPEDCSVCKFKAALADVEASNAAD